MRLLRLLLAPLVVTALGCGDATSPRPLARDTRASFALAVPSTTTPQVRAGGHHTCALKPDGTVICWGRNVEGEATPPAALTSVAQLGAGGFHTCALKTNGTVVCWGSNQFGQATVPAGLTSVAEVSVGFYDTCALKTDGTAVCWGYDFLGEATVPDGLSGIAHVSAGFYHSCAVKTDGTIACWGNDGFGEVSGLRGLTSATQVAAGQFHTCALKAEGTVSCSGWDLYGMTIVPSGLASVVAISGGLVHTCALKVDQTISCWGESSYGEIAVPVGLVSVAQMSANGYHTCALKTTGMVICWGDDDYGQTEVPRGLNLSADRTPPVVTHVISGTPSASGWYASDVTVTFSATDPESPVTTTGCRTQSISASTGLNGVTFTCVATSAGGATTDAVTIKLDKIAPVVTYAGNSGSYTVDQTVVITCTPSDNLSGVASSTCAALSGGAYAFQVGSNTFTATAIDNAGNVGTGATTFTVNVTTASVCALVQRWVSSAGVAHSLCVKLQHGDYAPFRNELVAQSGQKISEANAAILLRLVSGL